MDLMIIANIAKKMEKTKNTAIFVFLFFPKLNDDNFSLTK